MERIKVLLVDDDVSLGSIYTMGLQHLGFEVHYVSSFISVVGTINEFQPNIIILDIELGAKNGIDESETIFRLFPNLPIIFISSHTETEYIQRAIKNGGISYLKKPFDIEELGVYIKRFAIKGRSVLGIGDFQYSPSTLKLYNTKTFETQKLSNQESLILLLLIKNIGNVIPRANLEQKLWRDNKYSSTDTMLNNIISHLRKHLSTDPSIQIITTPRIGYELSVNRS